MLTGFQKYLVDKGFKRTCTEHCGKNEIEDYINTFLSSYNPLHYNFKKDDKYCYWGLCEHGKSPVMFLGNNKIMILQNQENIRTNEDGYRIIFSKWNEDKFDDIYDVFVSKGKYFKIDCRNEKNITIEILNNTLC